MENKSNPPHPLPPTQDTHPETQETKHMQINPEKGGLFESSEKAEEAVKSQTINEVNVDKSGDDGLVCRLSIPLHLLNPLTPASRSFLQYHLPRRVLVCVCVCVCVTVVRHLTDGHEQS